MLFAENLPGQVPDCGSAGLRDGAGTSRRSPLFPVYQNIFSQKHDKRNHEHENAQNKPK